MKVYAVPFTRKYEIGDISKLKNLIIIIIKKCIMLAIKTSIKAGQLVPLV